MGSGGNPLDPATISNLHVGARQFADQNARLNPGTPEFQAAFNKINNRWKRKHRFFIFRQHKVIYC